MLFRSLRLQIKPLRRRRLGLQIVDFLCSGHGGGCWLRRILITFFFRTGFYRTRARTSLSNAVFSHLQGFFSPSRAQDARGGYCYIHTHFRLLLLFLPSDFIPTYPPPRRSLLLSFRLLRLLVLRSDLLSAGVHRSCSLTLGITRTCVRLMSALWLPLGKLISPSLVDMY